MCNIQTLECGIRWDHRPRLFISQLLLCLPRLPGPWHLHNLTNITLLLLVGDTCPTPYIADAKTVGWSGCMHITEMNIMHVFLQDHLFVNLEHPLIHKNREIETEKNKKKSSPNINHNSSHYHQISSFHFIM